jgi:hypothetical protein
MTNWETDFDWLTSVAKKQLSKIITAVLSIHIPDNNYVSRVPVYEWYHPWVDNMIHISHKFPKSREQNSMDIYNKKISNLIDFDEIENIHTPATPIIWVTQAELKTVIDALPWLWINCLSSQHAVNHRTNIYVLMIDTQAKNSILYVSPYSSTEVYPHCDWFDTAEFKEFKKQHNITNQNMWTLFEMNKEINNSTNGDFFEYLKHHFGTPATISWIQQ